MSTKKQQPIVSAKWLHDRLARDDVVIADCRFELGDPAAGRRAYERAHIPDAIYFDLEEDLSGPVTGRGGRHPLPNLDEFCAKLGRRGIGDGITVVCYDDQQGQMAARLWWMLRYVGHDDVALLDGGYSAWRAAGYPVTESVPTPTPRQFTPRLRPDMVASMDAVRKISEGGRGVIIDSRAPERFRGETEPLDPVAGHIPGARNLPWMDNVTDIGFLRDQDDLRRRFDGLPDDMAQVVLHCGSGVSACVNLLAMELVGRGGAKLYVGGWSDWCSVQENPVASGSQKDD